MTRTLTHRYQPRGSCRQLFSHRGPEVLLSGPAGTGKSRACLEKVHAMMLANPGARGLIVRKVADSLTSTALVTWRDWVIPEALATGLVEYYGGSSEEPAQYRYTNGSRVMVGGMNKPTRIMSTEYDVIYVQEAIELTATDWEALNTRLRNGRIGFQQLIGDTNPDRPTHWLYHRSNSQPSLRMMPSRHSDNPRLYDDVSELAPEPADVSEDDGRRYRLTEYGVAYMARLDALTGFRRMRLRDGQWVAAEGMVYPEFDPAVHMVDPFPIPEHWPRRWSIDFGFRHPFVCSMWARDDDGGLWRYREHFGTERTVEDWAEIILASVREHVDADWPDPDPDYDPDTAAPAHEHGRRVSLPGVAPARTSCRSEDHWRDPYATHHYRWTEPQPEVILCDHDAEGRTVLEKHLMLATVPAHKPVNEGIDLVKQRFKDARIHLLRGALVAADQKLREDMKPTCTEEELPGYRWDENKERPVKVEDDGCDTTRYVVAYEDHGSRLGGVRF